MACKLTYNGKQYNSEIALRYDVLKDKGLLDKYNELFNQYTETTDSTFEANRQALLEILPDDIFTISDKNQLLDRVINNGITMGYFYDKVIYLSRNAKVNTAYHEAFHAVFRTFLSDEQITHYLNKAKEQYGKPNDAQLRALRNTSSFYENLTNAQLENIYYEEKMAEDFSQYMSNKKPKTLLGRLFAKLKKFIEFIAQPYTIESLFQDIELGKYRTAKPVHSVFRKSPVFSLTTTNYNLTSKISAQDSQQIFSKVAIAALKDKKTTLTREEVETYLYIIKEQFKLDTWTKELSDLDPVKQSQVKARIAAIHNAISPNMQYETVGNNFVENTGQEQEWFEDNLKLITLKANNILKSITVEEESELDEEDQATQLRSESRQTKGSQLKQNEFIRNYLNSVMFAQDYFGIGIDITQPGLDDKHQFVIDGSVIFNTLRKNLSDVPKSNILNLILTNKDKFRNLEAFKERLVKDLLSDLEAAGFSYTRQELIDKSTDPTLIDQLFSNSNIFNAVVATFNQSRDNYITVIDKNNKFEVLNSNVASSADNTLFKWRQHSITKKLTTQQAIDLVQSISNSFKYDNVENAFIPNVLDNETIDFNEIVDKIYEDYRSLGITLSRTFIVDELLKVLVNGYKRKEGFKTTIQTVEALQDFVDKNLLDEYVSRSSKNGVQTGKGYKALTLRPIEDANKDNFNYNLYTTLLGLPKDNINPIAYIIDNALAPVKSLAYANMKFDETFSNESIIVGGKSLFAINPPHFLSELNQTLSSVEMQDALQLIRNGELGSARELFSTIFGQNSQYKYDEFLIDRIFNAYSNNLFFKGITSLEESKRDVVNILLKTTLDQISNYVLYDVGVASNRDKLTDIDKLTKQRNKEYDKLTKQEKLMHKLGLYDNQDSVRFFIPQVYSDKTTNRAVQFPVFQNLTAQELKDVYFEALKNELGIEYAKIQSAIEYFNNLDDTIDSNVQLINNYNYIVKDGISYMPVFKEGKFDGFRQIEKIYDKYGEYKGANLKPTNVRLDIHSLRAFNLFNFKNLPDAKRVVSEAMRGTDFDKINVNFNDWHENNMQRMLSDLLQDKIDKDIIYDINC